jgi:spermidine/putrescine transport system substrate-binding protein
MRSDRIRQAADALEGVRAGGPLSRGQFLAGAGAGVAAILAGCGGSSGSGSSATSTAAAAHAPATGPAAPTFVKGGTLNVYSWPDYFGPNTLKAWKAKTGATLNIATYQSNDELFAKLSTAAGSNYDIAIPTSSFVQAMSGKGMLQKLDPARIPWQYIDRSLLGKVFDPGNQYSIPKDYGTSGVLYDPVAVGGKIVTWQDFIDAMQKPHVSGKVRYTDDAQGGLGPGLWTLGYNYDTKDVAQWSKAADLVKSQIVPHIKQFGDTFNTDPITSGQILMTQADDSVARRAMLQNPKLAFVLPKPHTELWVDNYTITKGAADVDAAYSFIEYMLQPAVQVAETQKIGYAYVLPKLKTKLNGYKLGDIVFPTPAQFEYMQNSVIYPSIQGQIQNLWSQVKASAH